MMQFSCAYRKRKHYIKNFQVPPFSEAKLQLGHALAQVLLDDCPESLKDEMHLSTPLQGPGENLWLSPSDLLIDKVVLRPPLTAKHVKALTHEGILNIGEEIEAQWLAAVELEKRLALQNLEELLLMLAERDKERAVGQALRNCEKQFRNYMDQVNKEFEALLISELADLEATLREYYENLIEEQIKVCHEAQEQYLEDQIQFAVDAVVAELSEKFMNDLRQQERDLEDMYRAKLAGQHERHLQALENQEDVFTVVMKQLKHNLQCNNIASLMYVLCMERKKCIQEKDLLTNGTIDRLKELESEARHNHAEIIKLKRELQLSQRKLSIRECCLLGVIKQFQKFINYALRAVPTQAEFLLSVEKMMTLEITQALLKSPKKDGRPARMIMPWRKVSQESSTEPPPMHKDNTCMNEPDPPTPKEGDEELYAMTYANRVYVREDFRNCLTQEDCPLKRSSNALWSKSVADLITLIQDVNERETAAISRESDHGEREYSGHVGQISTEQVSSVAFVRHIIETEYDGLRTTNESVLLPKSFLTPHSQTSAPSSLTPSGVALLATTDSVMLMKEKLGTSLLLSTEDPDEIEINLIPAPSTATIKINKLGPRRITKYPSELLKGTYSEVTLKLTKLAKTQNKTKARTSASRCSKPKNSQDRKLSCKGMLSTISQHVDSMELITTRSGKLKKSLNVVTPIDTVDEEFPTQQVMIDPPSEISRDFPEINFERVAKVFEEVYKPSKPWSIYKKKSSVIKVESVTEQPINYLKQENLASIIGQDSKEVNNNSEDFTMHRIHSIMDVLKQDDSLLRIFTKCAQ